MAFSLRGVGAVAAGWIAACVVLLLQPMPASAYALTLVTDFPQYTTPETPYPGLFVTAELHLDTEGESDIWAFSVGMLFDPVVLQYRPDLSSANDYYPLYSPSGGSKGTAFQQTWLEPFANPPETWPGSTPAGFDQINFVFRAHASVATRATATDQYLATLVFEVKGASAAGPTFDFGIDFGGDVFWIDPGTGAVDVTDQVSTVINDAPEPSAGLQLIAGLVALSMAARRRRSAG